MRKLYIGISAFAVFLFSQIAHAIPTVAGATDLATDDANTYYGLMARADGWYVEGFNADGHYTGFSVQLTPSANVTPEHQALIGLAFDGNTFYALRDDSQSAKGTDTYSVVGFGLDGAWNGTQITLGPTANVAPSHQQFVGFDIAEEGFLALRNDATSTAGTDTWRVVGFDTTTGLYNGFNRVLDESPSSMAYQVLTAYNNSPVDIQASANVPEPSTGLLLASLLGLGLLSRKKLA